MLILSFWRSKSLLKDFELIADSSYKDPEKFIGNPVNALLVIKKLTKDLQRIVDTLNTYPMLKNIVDEIKDKILLPSNDDYKGSIEAIYRLEDTYLLEPMDIARGNLSQKHISRPLTCNYYYLKSANNLLFIFFFCLVSVWMLRVGTGCLWQGGLLPRGEVVQCGYENLAWGGDRVQAVKFIRHFGLLGLFYGSAREYESCHAAHYTSSRNRFDLLIIILSHILYD
jgi:hypothetical protein